MKNTIYILLKKPLFLFVIISATAFSSCKFDLTIAGTYTGTYSSSSLPVSNGAGTLTITDISPGRVNILFVSVGNPDVQLNNLIVTRTTILLHDYYYFTISTENPNYGANGNWNSNNYTLTFTNPSNPAFSFYGTK